MRHKKLFKRGSDFTKVIEWIQDTVKYDLIEIPGTTNLDPPEFDSVVSNDYVIAIHKVDDV